MKAVTIVYPHQLFLKHPAIEKGRTIYIVEEPLFLTEFPIHTQKLLLHRLSMQAYKCRLQSEGFDVVYLDSANLSTTGSVFGILAKEGVTHVHIVDTTDNWLERRIEESSRRHKLIRVRYESPLFMLPKEEAVTRYQKGGKHMARFYKQLRIDKKILVTEDAAPLYGEWSFDTENRKKIPKDFLLPDDISEYAESAEIQDALEWLATIRAERYGDTRVWIPWTHEGAQKYLYAFITERLQHFGDFEDAIETDHVRLFHSTLSPLLNSGLLTPQEVISAVIEYGEKHGIQFNNIEGFVRQVIGWREFIRASYECDGVSMRSKNFWNHTRALGESFWKGATGVIPLDAAIGRALSWGYSHHIERLMVIGNFMLLTETHPDEVYRWFMAMYVDAYDWVMVPNVYGMSQFADGGTFATKPYISGSSYIKKMSKYKAGSWEDLWTALYWSFIAKRRDFFASQHRLSMMPKLLEKMSKEKRDMYREIAQEYFAKNN